MPFVEQPMTMIVETRLEWKYSPPTYLEEPITLSFEGGALEIKDGTAIATIDPEKHDTGNSIERELTKKIESRLLAVQITTHKNYELSKPSRIDITDRGERIVHLGPTSFVGTIRFGCVDITIADKNGCIITDTKSERRNKQDRIALLIEKHRQSDDVLRRILMSYKEAVKDPANELVHLYEIRDALSRRFRSKKTAMRKLGIDRLEWNEIGELANARPLKQGRHRGKAVGPLRDAENVELEKARKIVAGWVEKYLEYLEALL